MTFFGAAESLNRELQLPSRDNLELLNCKKVFNIYKSLLILREISGCKVFIYFIFFRKCMGSVACR